MTTHHQQSLCQALAHSYRVLADLVTRSALAEESRRQILATLLILEREIDAWSTLSSPTCELELAPSGADFEEEPTQPAM
jgi:hypothetical protein